MNLLNCFGQNNQNQPSQQQQQQMTTTFGGMMQQTTQQMPYTQNATAQPSSSASLDFQEYTGIENNNLMQY
jgi:hypothetical protein